MLTGTRPRSSRPWVRDSATVQPIAQRTGRHGEHDVVDRAAELVLDDLEVGQARVNPAVTPVRADLGVERQLGRRVEQVPADLADALRHLERVRDRLARVLREACGATAEANRELGEPLHPARHQLGVGRLGVRLPGPHRRRQPDRHGVGVEQHGREVDARDAVDQRVVRLADQREAISLEPLHQPHLPERLRAVELLGEDAADQQLELVVVAGLGQRRVAHVVAHVQPRVVDPDRAAGLQRREGELLPVARHQVQARLDVIGELVVGRRRPLEDAHAADVHVRALVLLGEEACVCGAEAVEVHLAGLP